MIHKVLSLALLAMLLSSEAGALFEKGGATGVGARPLGMGGAFVALADESSAVYWNPAGLSDLKGAEVYLSYDRIFNGKIEYYFPTFAVPLWKGITIGGAWERKDFVDSSDHAIEDTVYFSLATPLMPNRWLMAGMNCKYLSATSDFPDVGGTGFGIDTGLLLSLPLKQWGAGKDLRFGWSVQDWSTTIEEKKGVTQELPVVHRIGTSYRYDEWVAVEADLENFKDSSVSKPSSNRRRFGIEIRPGALVTFIHKVATGMPFPGDLDDILSGLIALRCGYVGFATVPGRFSTGASLAYYGFGLDYAYLGHAGNLGDSHRFSFSYSLGRKPCLFGDKRPARPAEPPPAPQIVSPPPAALPTATPETRLNIAVADLQADGVSSADASVIANLLRGELVKTNVFNVIEKQNMEKVLSEQAFQQTGCTTQECAIKLGKLLNVQRIVVGSFGKLLSRYFINVRVVNVETGKVTYADEAKGETVDAIEAGLKLMSARLAINMK